LSANFCQRETSKLGVAKNNNKAGQHPWMLSR
jgi:hypothetical protein